jgi:hypothetical protein
MGIANIINVTGSAGGGEIIRELSNSSDGQGLHFDGVAGNIDLATPPDLGNKFSFEFVVKADSTGSSGKIIDFGDGGRFTIEHNTTGLQVKPSNSGGWVTLQSPSPLADLKVHHLVLTVDGTSATLYDNGNQTTTATISATDIDSCADAKIGSYFDSATDLFNGSIYRCRFYNKALTQAEVDSAYQRADVDFADQYGSQTIAGTFANTSSGSAAFGTLTGVSATGFTGPYNNGNATNRAGAAITGGFEIGKEYRISFDYALNGATGAALWASSGPALSGVELISALSGTSFSTTYTPTATSAYLQFYIGGVPASGNFVVSNFVCDQIGAVSDYDLAFSNPTQSLMIQDRAGVADGTASASGVSQTQKIPQLNATAIAVSSATARTPADGAIVADTLGVACTPTVPLDVVGVAQFLATGSYGLKLHGSNGNQSGILDTYGNHDLEFRVNNSTKMVIDTSGNLNQAGGKYVLADGSGANVGEISNVNGNNLTISGIQTNHCGVSLATNAILPCTQSTVNNNTVDLGANGNAFKDFHLGGAANIGGLATFGGGAGQMGVTINGSNQLASELKTVNFYTLANDSTLTFESPSAVFAIYIGDGQGALFFSEHQSATVTKLAGSTVFAAGSSSGDIRVFTAGNDDTVTVQNKKSSGTAVLKIMVLGV